MAVDISVYVLTYFHEQYIREALDSILAQKTKYNYEIVVSDDGSTDKTMDILQEYREKYPNLLRVYHHDTNIGIPKNIFFARSHCKGKYIVGLAGDDYWIDNKKIEKQAQFLDTHPEFVAAGNAMELRYDFETKPFDVLPKKDERNRIFKIHNYEKGEILYSHGLMMRNFFLTEEGKDYFYQAQLISEKVDDAVDNLLILKKGDVFVLDEVSEVYRVPSNKKTSNNYNSKFSRMEKSKNTVDLLNALDKLFGNEINFKVKYENCFSLVVLIALMSGQFAEGKRIYDTIPKKFKKPFYESVFFKSLPKAFSFAVKRIVRLIKMKIQRI